MGSPAVAGGGFRFSQISVGGTWYWSVTADNILGAGQLYYVRDIETPFGKLTDGVDVPLPGDVVVSMAASMSQFQQQLAPLIALVAGQSTTINVTCTQGDPASQVGAINVVNAGAFGSFMTASATPTVPWLSASPTTIQGIGQNQQAQFAMILDPTTLQTASTPYTGVINLQDNRSPPTIIPITISVTVLPQPIILPNTECLAFEWNLMTAANNGSQQLIITNSGPATSVLGFTVAKVQNNSPWLQFSPVSASGLASGQTAIITFSVSGGGIPQMPGEYFETILISSPNASNSPVAIQVTLCVTECSPRNYPFAGYHPDGYPPFGEPKQPGACAPGQDWIPGGDYRGGPGEPYANGPGWVDVAPGNAPPAPGAFIPPPCQCEPRCPPGPCQAQHRKP
jgi:hypothetical protein